MQLSPARMMARWLPRGLAAARSLAILGAVMSGTAQAAYPGANGLIAFVRSGNMTAPKVG